MNELNKDLGEVLKHYGVKGMKWDPEKRKQEELERQQRMAARKSEVSVEGVNLNDKAKAKNAANDQQAALAKKIMNSKSISDIPNTKGVMKKEESKLAAIKKKVANIGKKTPPAKQGPPSPSVVKAVPKAPAKKTVSSYSRSPVPKAQVLKSPTPKKAAAPKKKSSKKTTVISASSTIKSTTSKAEQKRTIDRVTKKAYDKMSPMDKLKYKIRNR